MARRSGVAAPEVAERIRRPIPPGLSVLPQSLPVVSFGDPDRASVATLSLNPSWMEFQSQPGDWLLGGERRLASLRSLGAIRAEELSDEQVGEVVADCNSYFERPTWYRPWFHWLESLLSDSGAGSYLDGSACHLDLVQWATKPAQSKLRPRDWRRLVDQDREFLGWQLRASNVDVVLMNGASVVTELEEAGLADGLGQDVLTFANSSGQRDELRVAHGQSSGVLLLGWNRPLASAIARDGRRALLEWIRERLARHHGDGDDTSGEGPTHMTTTELDMLIDGYVPIGSEVRGVGDLAQVLRHWLEHSDRPTVGDVGAYGGSPVLHVADGDFEFVINRDTKRAAVERFLQAVDDAGGADQLGWHVAPNSRGKLNRATYEDDDAPTPGWYAYTKEPRGAGRRDRAAVVTSSDVPSETSDTGREQGDLCVVQFVHPGFEYHHVEHVGHRSRPTGVMPWKDGGSEHDRKFLIATGSILDPRTGTEHLDATVAFWGEWEGPSVYWRIDSPGKPLPSIVHSPFRPTRLPNRSVQNTDPLVFGDHFVYSNCLQHAFTSLRRLTPGSIVLFGRHGRSHGEPRFELDTCLVIVTCQRIESHPPQALGDDLLADAVLGPLFTETEEPTTLAVYSGCTRSREDGERPFSFVPAARVADDLPLFPRPSLRPVGALDGVITPAKNQGIKITDGLSASDRDAVWHEVVSQVAAQGCELAYHVEAPSLIDDEAPAVHSQGPPRALGR